MSVNQLFESPAAVISTNTVAVGAVSSPLWLSYVSTTAASLLPILGCTWLLIQIVYHFKKKDKE